MIATLIYLFLLSIHSYHSGWSPEDRQDHGDLCSWIFQTQQGEWICQVWGCCLHSIICHHDASHSTTQSQCQTQDNEERMGLHEQRCVYVCVCVCVYLCARVHKKTKREWVSMNRGVFMCVWERKKVVRWASSTDHPTHWLGLHKAFF